jgi:drug/metabolite transporter (DMT)-like permease
MHVDRFSRFAVPIAFITLGLIWGSSFLWIKIAVDELPAATVVAQRLTIGFAGMAVFLRFTGTPMPRAPRELLPLAIMGLLNGALPYLLITWGEEVVDSATAAVLNSLTPIFSLVIAGLLLRTEPVTYLRVIGLVVGFAGAALLATREFELRNDPAGLVGAAAVTLAALSYAVAASYAKRSMQVTHRNVVATGTALFGAIFAWPLALVSDGVQLPTQPDTILAVVWLGIMGACVAYLLYFYLIAELGATLGSMVTYVFPVVGVALGVVVLGELLDLRLVIGTTLVLAGIGIVSLRYDAAVRRAARGRNA